MSGMSGSGSGGIAPVARAGTTGWAKLGLCGHNVVSFGNCCAGTESCGDGVWKTEGRKIYYYHDLVVAPDRMEAALDEIEANGWATVEKHIWGEQASFAAALEVGDTSKDLAIFFLQAGEAASSPAAYAALTAWMEAGGRALASTGNTDTFFRQEFGAQGTGSMGRVGEPAQTLEVVDSCLSSGFSGGIDVSDQFGNIPGEPLGSIPGNVWFGMEPSDTNPGRALLKFTLSPAFDEKATIVSSDGKRMINGFFPDALDDATKGKQLFINEINYLMELLGA